MKARLYNTGLTIEAVKVENSDKAPAEPSFKNALKQTADERHGQPGMSSASDNVAVHLR